MQLPGDARRSRTCARGRPRSRRPGARPPPTFTTVGQERAILRLFGVTGVDRAGRPLAAEVVDRYLAPDPVAARRRHRAPVRDGHGRVRPAAAGARARGRGRQRGPRAGGGAARRVGPAGGRRRQRGARSPGPRWSGSTPTGSPGASCSACWATRGGRGSAWPWAPRRSSTRSTRRARAIDAGAELIRVDVPPSRELAELRDPRRTAGRGLARRARVPRRARRPRPGGRPGPRRRPARARGPAPVRRRGGRAPSRVRPAADRRPAARRARPGGRRGVRADRPASSPTRCARSSTGRVDPDRALADHVFAHRLLARAGTRVLVPAGPLLVAPRPRRGHALGPGDARRAGPSRCSCSPSPSPAATGCPPSAVVVEALPDWLVDEPGAPVRAAAEVALRRALLPEPSARVRRAAAGPRGRPRPGTRWSRRSCPTPATSRSVQRAPGDARSSVAETRAAAAVAMGLRAGRSAPELSGPAADHATAGRRRRPRRRSPRSTTRAGAPSSTSRWRSGRAASARRPSRSGSSAFDPLAVEVAGAPGWGAGP